MFRIVVAALAIIGLASLFTDVGAGLAIGALALAPLLFLIKLVFFAFLFSWFVRGARRPGRSAEWSTTSSHDDVHDFMNRMGRRVGSVRRPTRRHPEDRPRPSKEAFERWHDLAHAKEEVDSWVEDADIQ